MAQMSSSELFEKALIQLELQENQVAKNLVADENISQLETILVIPVINFQEEEVADYDVNILIVNRNNGSILSRFFEKNAWTTDAFALRGVNISYQPFKISRNLKVIGITTRYEGSSSVVISGSDYLSLFIRNDLGIVRLLEDYIVYEADGEHDQRGNGQLETHDKTIESVVSEKSFYDLQITDHFQKTVIVDGVEKIIEKSENTEKLIFEDGQFVKSK
jgi:hypothetical protein